MPDISNADIEQLILAVNMLKLYIDGAKNLCYNGKIVQCDRKLQGAQVRCDNIIKYLVSIKDADVSHS